MIDVVFSQVPRSCLVWPHLAVMTSANISSFFGGGLSLYKTTLSMRPHQ